MLLPRRTDQRFLCVRDAVCFQNVVLCPFHVVVGGQRSTSLQVSLEAHLQVVSSLQVDRRPVFHTADSVDTLPLRQGHLKGWAGSQSHSMSALSADVPHLLVFGATLTYAKLRTAPWWQGGVLPLAVRRSIGLLLCSVGGSQNTW